MQYVITYSERPSGSAKEYEAAQKRILELFGKFQFPDDFKVKGFWSQIGRWSGSLLLT